MRTTTLYRAVRLANILLFAVALAVLLDGAVASAISRYDGTPHWHSDQRSLTVVDRTGDPAWEAATRHAVAAWNAAAGGTGLRLNWTSGPGGCRPEGTTVVICAVWNQSLNAGRDVDRDAVANVELGGDRSQPHILRAGVFVCGDCLLGAGRRQVIATHELGHVLGLPHSDRPESLMSETGGALAPDAQDTAHLQAVYAHADGPDRCGFFDARVGPLCF